MSIVELLEQKAIDNGYPGLVDWLHEGYSPSKRYFWLTVQALTGLVPFPIVSYIKRPRLTLRLTYCGLVSRVRRRFYV